MEKRIIAYSVVSTLEMLGWGIYLAFFARYLSVVLMGGSEAVIVFTSLNWGFTLLSVLVSRLLCTLGERGVILLGLLCSLPPFIVILSDNPFLIAAIAPLSALPWGLMWSVVVKSVFYSSRGSAGWGYGLFTAGRGVGAFVGSVLTGPLYALGGVQLIVTAIALILVLSVLGYYGLHIEVQHADCSKNSPSVSAVVSKLWNFYVSLTLVVYARELLYAMAPPKLDSDIKLVFSELPDWAEYAVFGALFSGGALISPLARLLAGKLVDQKGTLVVYAYTVASYALVYWAFMKTTGLFPIIVWQIPLFPFLDTSIHAHIAKNLDMVEVPVGVAASLTFTAIGGLLVLLALAPGRASVDLAGATVTASCAISILLVLGVRRIRNTDGS